MIIKRPRSAQSTIEFTFAVIAVMFLIYGMIIVFRWTGMDLANRRVNQDASLTNRVDPSEQLNSGEDEVLPIAAMYHGNITTGNTSD